ncbi:hypothetical protein Athai_15080 [Actinocatenispora thailandica]|uniref:DNA-directed RNA polymerase specialized sigma24 family protein n=2 Tax=Actinocatenispora thailandica TaxID=227318 RepID=A0A7R7DLQ8_9ACTN|nr:hypothetical protein Athai_15080 [Actinocatenispora thailandica]
MAFLLSADDLNRQRRAGRAHRLARRALPHRSGPATGTEEAARTLLARLVRAGLRRTDRPAPGWRAAPAPPGEGHAAIDAALATSAPAVRAGYGLLVGERLGRTAASQVLRDAGVTDTAAALTDAQAVRDRLARRDGLAVDDQERLLREAPMDPTVVRLRAPDPSALRLRGAAIGTIALAAAVALAVTAGLVLHRAGRPAARRPAATTPAAATHLVDAGAWRGSFHPGVQLWPSRGELTGRTALIQRAARSWTATAAATGAGSGGGGSAAVPAPRASASVLYAGNLDGHTVVLLSDGRSLARYTERHGDGRTEVDQAPRADVYAASALRLATTAAGTRYLLAPWVRRAQWGSTAARWHRLTIHNGVSGPVAAPPSRPGCWRGPVLRLTAVGADLDEPIAVGDTGAAAMPHLMYIPPVPPPHITRPHELTYQDGPQVFQEMSCSEDHAAGADSMTNWRFWAGQLPEAVDASWVCLRVDQADGSGDSTSALVPDGDAPIVVARTTSGHACTRLAKDLVATAWWQAPSGQWYFLAAGSRHVASITVDGQSRDGRFTALGPYRAKGKPHPSVSARNEKGAAVTVLTNQDG